MMLASDADMEYIDDFLSRASIDSALCHDYRWCVSRYKNGRVRVMVLNKLDGTNVDLTCDIKDHSFSLADRDVATRVADKNLVITSNLKSVVEFMMGYCGKIFDKPVGIRGGGSSAVFTWKIIEPLFICISFVHDVTKIPLKHL